METMLHAVMVIAGTAGLSSVVFGQRAGRRVQLLHWLPMAVMLAAMVDLSVNASSAHQLSWCVVMLLLLSLPILAARECRDQMAMHRVFSVLAMFEVMAVGVGTHGSSIRMVSSHIHGTALEGLTPVLVGVGCAAFVVFSARVAVVRLRPESPSASAGRVQFADGVEVISSAVAVTAMAMMMVV